MRRTRVLMVPLVLFPVSFVACTTTDAIRGEDHDVLVPSGLVRVDLRRHDAPAEPKRFQWAPKIEAGAAYLDGTFRGTPAGGDHTSTVVHAGFAPEFTLRGVRFGPVLGLAYGELDADTGSLRASERGIAAFVGGEALWQLCDFAGPYARISRAEGGNWDSQRIEFGLDLRPCDDFGLRVAYARQRDAVDFDGLGSLYDDEAAFLRSSGLLLGLSLRF